ncbi:berberine bridge enzyme-like 8 [Apium graveolens]|uniref:berberine bridge enzyme-like 8 n=1 Tax=Apium graveolens TaxID=4045 RepID=UPI003D7B1410
MKIAVCFFLSFALFSCVSSANLPQTHQGFLRCLTRVSPNADAISKVVYTRSNSSYSSILKKTLQNLRFDTPETPKPLVIVTPVDASQIQTVIYCAKKNNVQMRIRGGGHDFEGVSYVSEVPFVLLDMFNLREVDVDVVSKTATIQAGATLGEVYYAIASKSNTLGFPAGFWSTVGATGLIGGGGYGILRRKYGLAADNVFDARMIDVNGRILDRKAMGEELFWAIRGGGASSFGVILSWKVNLVDVPEIMTVFQVEKKVEEDATDVVYLWQSLAPKLPKDVEIRVAIDSVKKDAIPEPSKTVLSDGSGPSVTPDQITTLRIRFFGTYLGRKDALLALMQQSFPELGLTEQGCQETSYIQAVLIFGLFSPTSSLDALLERTSFKIPLRQSLILLNSRFPNKA